MALVPLRTSADATGKAAETLASIEEHGNVMPVLRAVSNAQTAFSAFVRYSAALVYRLELPARVRELVIMRAAAHWRSRYEWGEHYTFASGAGVTEDELRVLHTLTGWALQHGYVLKGLAVVRVTLEDIYLQLTRDALESDEAHRR